MAEVKITYDEQRKKLKKSCRYCKTKENLTVDHKIPKYLGGSDNKKNLQCLCVRCNTIKSKMTHKQVMYLFKWFLRIQEDRVANNRKPYQLKKKTIKIYEHTRNKKPSKTHSKIST